MLSFQSPGRASASRQRGKESGRGSSLAVMSIPQANVSEPAARQGIGKGKLTSCRFNPPANVSEPTVRRAIRKGELTPCHVNPQASVSKLAARQGIRKGELTRCHVNSPGKRQRAGSPTGIQKGGAHILSCQSPRQASASRRCGKGCGNGNSLAVMSITQANVSEPAAQHVIWRGGTHKLSCQSPRRASASLKCDKRSGSGNSLAVIPIAR